MESLKERSEIRDEVKELQMIVNLMSFIAMDFKEISCLESLAVFDSRINTIFCESKTDIKNDRDGRMKVENFLKDHREVHQCVKTALKTGNHSKTHVGHEKSILAIPIMGVKKAIGVVGIIYASDGCEHESCTTDLIFKDMMNIFIVKYKEMKEKESMASLACKLKTLEDYEKYAILETGKRCNWNITVMARELAIGRNTLYNKMKKMGIS